MHLKEKLVLLLSGFFISSFVWSMPALEFLQSCTHSKPANALITMTLLDGFGSVNDADTQCKNHFDTEINGQIYGAVVCNEQPYIIIADKKISTATAENYSMNALVKPDIPILRFSQWWRMDKGDTSYLCIQTPLSDTGSAANSWQYYLIEDAFNVNKAIYPMYYYFFDKNAYKRL